MFGNAIATQPAGSKAKTAQLDTLFTQLIEAIVKRRVVEMHYHMSDSRECRIIEMEPYHLRYCGDRWYVIGKSKVDNAVSVLNLNRIRELKVRDRYFFRKDEFDVDEYLGRAWSIEPEGRLYNVKLKFSPQIACDVAATQWHRTQKTNYQSVGSAIIEFCVDSLNEIK